MKLLHGFRSDNLLGDVYGGITVAVVALHLALALAVASGAFAIEDVTSDARNGGKHVFLSGAAPNVSNILDKLAIPDTLPAGAVLDTRLEALQQARAAPADA